MLTSFVAFAQLSPSIENNDKNGVYDNQIQLDKNDFNIEAWISSDSTSLNDGYKFCHLEISYNPPTYRMVAVNITIKYVIDYGQSYEDTITQTLLKGDSNPQVKLASCGIASFSERITRWK